jgi:hypothetical protein
MKYGVTLVITDRRVRIVEADSKDEAILKAMKGQTHPEYARWWSQREAETYDIEVEALD